MSAILGVVDVAGVRTRVERCLSEFLDAKRATAAASASPHELMLLDPLRDLVLSGGKRLRAAFCYWGWRGAAGPDGDGAVTAGAALELLHAAALVHDDVMDGSALRRGQPALHRRLASEHVVRTWRGSAEHFGISAAIVAGDLCLVWADQLLRASGLPAARLEQAGRVYDTMREETIRGQYLDLAAQASGVYDVDEALRVAAAKTATSTATGPLRFGGVLAGASEPLLDRYSAYGHALGVAFQLRDDLLGAFGDAQVTGKPVGDDLRDGKCTVLLAEARRRAGPAAADRIDVLLNERTDEAVRDLRALIEDTGAPAHVEHLVHQLGTEAIAALEPLDGQPALEPDVRDVLRDIAVLLTSKA
jgi:geranylgeranyl diphosphate synthase, type I